MDDFQSSFAMDRPKNHRLWTWEDSSKIVNMMTCHMLQAQKYGLDMPVTNSYLWSKEELEQRENQLMEYFLYEMRKPAQ